MFCCVIVGHYTTLDMNHQRTLMQGKCHIQPAAFYAQTALPLKWREGWDYLRQTTKIKNQNIPPVAKNFKIYKNVQKLLYKNIKMSKTVSILLIRKCTLDYRLCSIYLICYILNKKVASLCFLIFLSSWVNDLCGEQQAEKESELTLLFKIS